ncbi:spore coat putative kinase YutH [Siminovitchia sediminis]|uniref:Spore coat putative kinase YutH n=1 Tax=Siminovitchia sediminis TaxID=1274353 RepID=A0ABW4KKW6_9BACI
MSMEVLEKYFNIKADRSIRTRRYTRYVSNGLLYTIVNVTHVEQEVLIELYEMSEHMAKHSDKKVSRFVAAQEGTYLVTHDNEDFVLLQNQFHKVKPNRKTGRQLARFHYRGKQLQSQVEKLNRTGEWKKLWASRLDQMEKAWAGMSQEPPRDEFDKMFLESFPYYMGLCENAIQYVTDTELDEQPQYSDYRTITHKRFYDSLWKSEQEIRNPFDWVVDHPSRDLSEWIRDRYFKGSRTCMPDIKKFLYEYQTLLPISSYAWRLLYARLLFPLHYIECVEEYYSSSSQSVKKELEEKMSGYLRDTQDYEQFLRVFYDSVGIKKPMPVVEWL